jgi:hypothetical protein
MATVDRKKYAVDVLEHVLGGVRATTDETVEETHSEVVRLGVRPWLALGTADTLRQTRPGSAPVRMAAGRRESVRRGEDEHRGPHERQPRRRRERKARPERER